MGGNCGRKNVAYPGERPAADGCANRRVPALTDRTLGDEAGPQRSTDNAPPQAVRGRPDCNVALLPRLLVRNVALLSAPRATFSDRVMQSSHSETNFWLRKSGSFGRFGNLH